MARAYWQEKTSTLGAKTISERGKWQANHRCLQQGGRDHTVFQRSEFFLGRRREKVWKPQIWATDTHVTLDSMVHSVWEKNADVTCRFSGEVLFSGDSFVLFKSQESRQFSEEGWVYRRFYWTQTTIIHDMWYITSHKDVRNTPKWNKFQNSIYIVIPSLWNNNQQLY